MCINCEKLIPNCEVCSKSAVTSGNSHLINDKYTDYLTLDGSSFEQFRIKCMSCKPGYIY